MIGVRVWCLEDMRSKDYFSGTEMFNPQFQPLKLLPDADGSALAKALYAVVCLNLKPSTSLSLEKCNRKRGPGCRGSMQR